MFSKESQPVITEWQVEIDRIFLEKARFQGVGTNRLRELVAKALSKDSLDADEYAGFMLAAAELKDEAVEDLGERTRLVALSLGAIAWLYIPAPTPDYYTRFKVAYAKPTLPYHSRTLRQGWAASVYHASKLAGSAQEIYGARTGFNLKQEFAQALLNSIERYLRLIEVAETSVQSFVEPPPVESPKPADLPLSESDDVVSKHAKERPRRRRIPMIAIGVTIGVTIGVAIAVVIAFAPVVIPNLQPSFPSVQDPGETEPLPSVNESEYVRGGWGPEREVFTTASGGPSFPAFNSITDNPNIGDERNFVGLRQQTTADVPNIWHDDVWADPGDVFYMRVYVKNSEAVTNATAEFIQDAKLKMWINSGENAFAVFGMLSAANAETVWDGATIHTDPGVEVVLDPGTVLLENNAHPDGGLALGTDAFSDVGQALGFDAMDGLIKPGYQFASYVTVQLRVVKSDSGPLHTSSSPVDSGTAVATAGWGPLRDAIAYSGRGPKAALNSMIDHPEYGDERNFFEIKPDAKGDDSLDDSLLVKAGDTISGHVYFSNDAIAGGESATGVRLRLQVPATFQGSDTFDAILSADNVSPAEIWDSVVVALPSPDEGAAVRYVQGSAAIHVAGALDESLVDVDDLFGEGALIGCSRIDGVVEADCSGWVSFELVIAQPNFTVVAQARVKGSDDLFADGLQVGPGTVLEVRVEYRNTGTTQQNNVTMRSAELPSGLRFVEGSARLATSNTANKYEPVEVSGQEDSYDIFANIGNYAPGANAFMKYEVMVRDESSPGYVPGSHWLSIDPLISVDTANGSKSASLTMTIFE